MNLLHQATVISMSLVAKIYSDILNVTVAPIKLKKVREKPAAPWYKTYTPLCQERNL